MKLRLPQTEHTLRLGRLFATSLPPKAPYPPILLRGALGAGKTTFVRGLVKALPDGDQAEVASPSFNLVNYYPTKPPVMHVDLYRLDGLRPDEELLEYLESNDRLTLIEWAQYLPEDMTPESCLVITLAMENDGRTAELEARGEMFHPYYADLEAALTTFL